ncbi:Protein PLANT CADMIUM RESISTANCE 2 [Bienertia sinuspersici]
MEKPATAVPISSPVYAPLIGTPPQGQWSSGLFDCTTDVSHSCGVSGALYGLIGMISGFHFIYTCAYRGKLKRQFGISASPIEDLCTHIWCHPCALCQEHRELQYHGYDVPLGWVGNLEKKNGGMGMVNPPMVPGGMSR